MIDDEPIIAETLILVFSNAGYETRAVQSAEAALTLLESEKWTPHFAIIDVNLPRMNGIDLAIVLKEQYPQVQVFLFSGRAATSDPLEVARQRGHSFDVIAKPVHPTIFLEMLASSLLREADDEGTPLHQYPSAIGQN